MDTAMSDIRIRDLWGRLRRENEKMEATTWGYGIGFRGLSSS